MTFEEETRAMFAVQLDKLNRIEASTAHQRSEATSLVARLDAAVAALNKATAEIAGRGHV